MTKTSARKAVAEKAHSTYRKTATKAVAEKARGTYRKTAAQFEEVQPGDAMEGYVHSIEKAALKNKTFRTVLYTAKNCQLVVMNSSPVKISARRYTSSISFSG